MPSNTYHYIVRIKHYNSPPILSLFVGSLARTKIMHKVVKHKSYAYCSARSFQYTFFQEYTYILVMHNTFFAYILYGIYFYFFFFFDIFLIVRVLLYRKTWHRQCHHSFVDIRANENYIRCIRVKGMCIQKKNIWCTKPKENGAKKQQQRVICESQQTIFQVSDYGSERERVKPGEIAEKSGPTTLVPFVFIRRGE